MSIQLQSLQGTLKRPRRLSQVIERYITNLILIVGDSTFGFKILQKMRRTYMVRDYPSGKGIRLAKPSTHGHISTDPTKEKERRKFMKLFVMLWFQVEMSLTQSSAPTSLQAPALV